MVKYIGADDKTLDIFESQYPLSNGMSYNSFVILDDKVAVTDTSDSRTGDVWKANLKQALGDRNPDFLIVHHMEPDHSKFVADFLRDYPCSTVVASAKALQIMAQFFPELNLEGRSLAVKEGDVLDLGEHKLQFIAAPMIHWPEVMMSFDTFDGTLYSADAFGRFGAIGDVPEDMPMEQWTDEAARYYLNIVGKYGPQVQALLAKAATLPIKRIRPLHGPQIVNNIPQCLSLYDKWSKYEPEFDGVLIACASIYGNTLKAASKMQEILLEGGVPAVELVDLTRSDISANVAKAFRYSKLIVAASSYDAGLYTPMCDFLHRLRIKGWCNRKVGIIENGSWAPSAGKVMKEILTTMKGVETVEPTVTIRSSFKDADLETMRQLAENL